MYSLRDCVRFGLVLGAGLGLLTETIVAVGSGRPGTVHMLLRGAVNLVGVVPLG
ncbi:MAG: hypothetical protein JNK67_10585 [Alphaproteobacteria bacterium]|nr:hypothetical protein [Alphaproteobacteria bacterium]